MSSDICKHALCVSNLTSFTDQILTNLFGSYGKFSYNVLASSDLNKKEIIVEFISEEHATKALNETRGKVVNGNTLFVDYAKNDQLSNLSSTNNLYKQKASVLDRIIKLGDPKYPKSDEKPLIIEKRLQKKETFYSESNGKGFIHISRVNPHPIDKNDISSKKYPNKREMTPHKDKQLGADMEYYYSSSYSTLPERPNQTFYIGGETKLEITRPKRENLALQRESSHNSNSRFDLQSNTLQSNIYPENRLKIQSNNQSSQNYYRNTYTDRSRSRSRSKSKNSNSVVSYNLSKSKRSRSPSFSRDHISRFRNCSGSKSQQKNNPSDTIYIHKETTYDKKSPIYLDSSKVQYGRASPRNDQYGSQRELRTKREDFQFDYKQRSKTRSKSRDRSMSRGSYQRSHYRSSRSRSPGERSSKTYQNIPEKSVSYGPRHFVKGGLVIEKRDVFGYSNGSRKEDRYGNRESGNVALRDRNNLYQKDSYDYGRSGTEKISKGHEFGQIRHWEDQKDVFNENRQERAGSCESGEITGYEAYANTPNLEQNNFLAFQEVKPNVIMQESIEKSLPSYLNPIINTRDQTDCNLVNGGNIREEEFSQSQFTQPNTMEKHGNEGYGGGTVVSNAIDEEQGDPRSLAETNDTIKTDEKEVSPVRKEMEDVIEEKPIEDNPLKSELMQNKKVIGLINYLLATGDKKGVQELLKNAAKSKQLT